MRPSTPRFGPQGAPKRNGPLVVKTILVFGLLFAVIGALITRAVAPRRAAPDGAEPAASAAIERPAGEAAPRE
jgi:hypothetical protein